MACIHVFIQVSGPCYNGMHTRIHVSICIRKKRIPTREREREREREDA